MGACSAFFGTCDTASKSQSCGRVFKVLNECFEQSTALSFLAAWSVEHERRLIAVSFSGFQRKVLDGSLGFAAGVMLAASFWSLLAPAIEIAETSGYYGQDGRFAFVPVALGFLLGALFVYAMDKLIPSYDGHKADLALAMQVEKRAQLKRRVSSDDE
ncbi:unnamed protein product, partial [Ixodes pacificus]